MTVCPRKLPLILGMVLGLVAVGGQAEVDQLPEPLLAVFYPYRQGPPQVEGITPGLRLDQSNFQLARTVLPAELLQRGLAVGFVLTGPDTTRIAVRERCH